MAHFDDMTSCTYFGLWQDRLIAVGWLVPGEEYQQGAVSEEFHPGFFASTLAHTLGPLRADVARDLAVEKFDCQVFQPDPRVFSPAPDGRALLFYSDVAKTAGGIARISAKDAESYPKFAAGLDEVARLEGTKSA